MHSLENCPTVNHPGETYIVASPPGIRRRTRRKDSFMELVELVNGHRADPGCFSLGHTLVVGPPGLTAILQWNWQSFLFHRNCQGLHTTLTCTFRLKVHSCLTIEALTSTRRRELVSDCPTLIVRVIFPAPPEDRIIFVGLTDALLA